MPVSAVVRWLRHGPSHRPAEVTRAGSSARPPLFPSLPQRPGSGGAGPAAAPLPLRPPLPRAGAVRESLSALRCREGRIPLGSARSPVRCRSAAGAGLASHRRRHRPRRGRAPGTAAGRRGRRRACESRWEAQPEPAELSAAGRALGGPWRRAVRAEAREAPGAAAAVCRREPSEGRGGQRSSAQHSSAGVLRECGDTGGDASRVFVGEGCGEGRTKLSAPRAWWWLPAGASAPPGWMLVPPGP